LNRESEPAKSADDPDPQPHVAHNPPHPTAGPRVPTKINSGLRPPEIHTTDAH